MPNPSIEILIQAKDEASKKLIEINKALGGMAGDFKKYGLIMLGASAAITAGLFMAVKAAAQEEAGIKRLSVAMADAGIQYDDVRVSLEKWIDTQAQKTAVSDSAQRSSLVQLITTTGNLAKSQDLLTIAMDLARLKSIDLETATGLIAKVYTGNISILSRYGIAIEEGTTVTEALTKVQKLAAGQAQAYGKTLAGQFDILRNNISDLKEKIGSVLTPVITELIGKANALVQALKTLDPALISIGTLGAVAAAVLTGVGGAFLMLLGFLPQLTRGFMELKIIMASTTAQAVLMNIAIAGWLVIAAAAVFMLGQLIYYAVNHEKSLSDEARAQRELNTAIVAGTVKFESLDEALRRGHITLGKYRDITEAFLTDAAKAARATSVWSGKQEDLSDAVKEATRMLNAELDEARDLHDTNIRGLDEEYSKMLRNLDLETGGQLKALQDQIDALEKQTRDEDRILEHQEWASHEADLRQRLASATTAEERADIEKELNDYLAYINRQTTLEERSDQEDNLRDQMDVIISNAADKKAILEDELETKKTHEDDMLATTTGRIKDTLTALNGASVETLALIDKELVAWKQHETDELTATLARLKTTQDAYQAFFTWLAGQTASVPTTPGGGGGGGMGPQLPPQGPIITPGPGITFQQGGVMPYTGMAYLHKGETVLPANTQVNVQVYLDSEPVSARVITQIGDKARLQGYS